MKMNDYQSAISVLDLGHSYAPENSCFDFLLSKIEKRVDGEIFLIEIYFIFDN